MGARKIQVTSRGTRITPSGVRITESEYREFQLLVKRNNVKRAYVEKTLRPFVSETYLKRSDKLVQFKPRKQSASLLQFKTKEDFNKEMRFLREATKRDFLSKRTEMYRENVLTAVRGVFGYRSKKARELIAKIKSLDPKKLQKLLLRNPYEFSISYIYYDESQEGNDKIDELLDIIEQVENED